MKKAIEVLGGWCLIGALIYIYVYKQAYLISSIPLLIAFVAIGTALGFFFSLLEAAVLSIGSTEEQAILQATDNNTKRKESNVVSEAQYLTAKNKYQRYIAVYTNRIRHVPPLIVLSNLSNLLTASLVPAALNRQSAIIPIQIDNSIFQKILKIPVVSFELPGSASAFIFFSSAIFILILAKIAPKQVGAQEGRRLAIVLACGRPILIFSWLLGWLGTAVNAPIEWALRRK